MRFAAGSAEPLFERGSKGWLDHDYRLGYLCGLIRGDGHLSSQWYDRPGKGRERRHVFRLGLVDIEPLRRAREYLDLMGVEVAQYRSVDQRPGHLPLTVLQSAAGDRVAAIQDAVAWPRQPTDSWCKGFLAGIYDAEGSHSAGLVRIANTDPMIIDWITLSMRRLGFRFIPARTGRPNGLVFIRLLGGVPEQLRFFLTTGPATTRKRSIEGVALKTYGQQMRVESVEPANRSMRLYDITTGTGDFIANGVVSHNCFARPTHTYLDFNAREDFEREIVVKVNLPQRLRAELARPSWGGDHVALGTNT
ncbi:MAG: intein-containing Rv2578c family radical SAM protein, partial [Geminicoccaceae bacterium]